MTGRAAGYCAGYGVPGFMNPFGGRGFLRWGRGRGGGRGWRHWFYATGLTGWQRAAMGWPAFGGVVPPMPGVQTAPSQETEKEVLTRQAEFLQTQLDHLRKRLEELATEEKTS